MTVSELMKILENEPGDKPVIIPGYEGDYDDVKETQTINVILNANTTRWYYGAHQEINDKSNLKPGQKTTKALLLS